MLYNERVVTKSINMLFYIEESLPFLNFTLTLNKNNVITQNLKKNPSILNMYSLSIISEPKADTSNPQMRKLSSELWNKLISCNIRQKQFKDNIATQIPSNYMPLKSQSSQNSSTKFTFTIEFNFNNELFQINSSDHSLRSHSTSTYNFVIELKSLDSFYDSIRAEWHSMCQIYRLIKEIKEALIKYPQLKDKFLFKMVNLKKLIVNYGPKFAYTIQFEWSKETKLFDITLGVNNSISRTSERIILGNPHQLFNSEVKNYFARTHSLINLINMLNSTWMFAGCVTKLINFPKINTRLLLNHTFITYSSFMVIVCGLNKIRLTFNSKHWIDIQMKPNGQLNLRDSYFDSNADLKRNNEQFSVLRFSNVNFILFFSKI